MTATRATSKTHPDHTKLSEDERLHVSILVHCNLWPKQAIADAYGITRKTVSNCAARYPL